MCVCFVVCVCECVCVCVTLTQTQTDRSDRNIGVFFFNFFCTQASASETEERRESRGVLGTHLQHIRNTYPGQCLRDRGEEGEQRCARRPFRFLDLYIKEIFFYIGNYFYTGRAEVCAPPFSFP